MYIGDATVAVYDKFRKAISTISDDPGWFSDPNQISYLPFPSFARGSSTRFDIKELDGSYYFRYMGRSQFKTLYDLAHSSPFLDFDQKIYLYGSSGSGKSHLLAALVDMLIHEGKRVVYIPECRKLAEDFVRAMKDAFSFAFPESANIIESFQDVNDLVQFSNMNARGTPFYVIVDQINALQSGEGERRDEAKTNAKHALDQIAYGQHYIFSASANEEANQRANERQSATIVMKLQGGMNDVC
jgi:Cdc6-like AAA superfamily ATPase